MPPTPQTQAVPLPSTSWCATLLLWSVVCVYPSFWTIPRRLLPNGPSSLWLALGGLLAGLSLLAWHLALRHAQDTARARPSRRTAWLQLAVWFLLTTLVTWALVLPRLPADREGVRWLSASAIAAASLALSLWLAHRVGKRPTAAREAH